MNNHEPNQVPCILKNSTPFAVWGSNWIIAAEICLKPSIKDLSLGFFAKATGFLVNIEFFNNLELGSHPAYSNCISKNFVTMLLKLSKLDLASFGDDAKLTNTEMLL